MANINDKTNLNGHVNLTDGKLNWISQIKAGEAVYDIATHHGITFKDGSNDTDGVTWNGLTDLEIIIPSITDIVQSPVVFAGTVGADGVVSWNDTHKDGPKTGYLVFITADCTFNEIACEAGDMAIYDGANWNVVSGENQVQLVGTVKDNKVTVAVGAATDVLTVEGKTLALVLDYADLNNNHLTTSTGEETSVKFDTMTVGSVGIKLNKAEDTATTIGEEKSFQNATALKDGTVSLTNATDLVKEVNFGTFTPGELPTFTPNSEKTFAVTGGNLTPTSGLTSGDFVDSVTFGDVTFIPADENDENKIQMITDITAGDGNEFLNGIHTTGENESADFTIGGYIAPSDGVNAKFVTGIAGNLNPVTSITTGGFKLVNGTDLATGFGAESESGEVLSSVTVTANNNTSVLNSAVVSNHVLSFETTNVTSDVTATPKYKSLTKTGFEYTAPVATSTSFVTSGFTQTSDVNYTFGRDKETTYSPVSAMWKISTPELKVTKGSYSINHTNMKATVPSGAFIASATQGSLPSLTGTGLTRVTVTGSVSTVLDTKEVSINALKSNSITMPGAYSLSTVAAESGDIVVGKEGDLAANVATVDLSTYLTGVSIVESK